MGEEQDADASDDGVQAAVLYHVGLSAVEATNFQVRMLLTSRALSSAE